MDFIDRFSKNIYISNSHQVFLADRRTDRHEEADSRFSQSCDVAKKNVPFVAVLKCRGVFSLVGWMLTQDRVHLRGQNGQSVKLASPHNLLVLR